LPRAESPFSPSSANPAIASSCRTILNNTDSVRLKQDLSGPDPCLVFLSGTGELDCEGHAVQGLRVSDMHDFSIRNCHTTSITATQSTQLTIVDNVVVADRQKTIGAGVWLANGHNNRVLQNTIDGGWHGEPWAAGGGYPPGADDGVVLDNEVNTVIQGNTIRNVWDCGIERLGNKTDSITIRNNTISNAAECGIGSWFAAGWRDSVFAGNTVTNSAVMVDFYFSPNQNRGVDHLTLRNNLFENNRFVNPSNPNSPSLRIDFGASALKLGLPVDVGNNIIRDNDFGADVAAPMLLPTLGFVDAGGNVCRVDGRSALSCAH
jgi:hypothetical protein